MNLIKKYKDSRFDLAKTYMEFEEDTTSDQVVTAEQNFLQAERNLLLVATHPDGPVAELGIVTGTFDQLITNEMRKAQILDYILQNW